ncbi:MAG: GNAT family N-acetyltransferase, partial [Pseudomonadota bacterium]
MFSVPPPCDAQLGMIRPMHETDLPAVLSIENQLYDIPWSQRNFLDALEAPYDCQVYCVADQVLAYSIVMLVFDEAHLLNISVSKSQQGRGLGRFLLRHAMAAAQAQGMLSVLLEV